MDPNITLESIRSTTYRIDNGEYLLASTEAWETIATNLASDITALDTWINSGGVLPRSWIRN